MSKNLILRTAAVLLIGTGAAFAQTTAPAPTAPKAGTTAPAPKATPAPAPKAAPATAPKATPAPKAAAPAPTTAPKAAAPAPAATAQMVNLNTATEAELDKLPQVGPARAKAIVEARAKGGKFKSWDDFVARNVVPKNAEDAIKGKVRF